MNAIFKNFSGCGTVAVIPLSKAVHSLFVNITVFRKLNIIFTSNIVGVLSKCGPTL